MKHSTLSGNKFAVLLVSRRAEDATLVRETLVHVYPGVEVEVCVGEKKLLEAKPNLLIIDTEVISGIALEPLLDRISDLPAILLIKDFSQIRTFSHLLTGRRAIISHSEIGGMGLIQNVHHLIERQKLHEQLQKTSHHLKELSIKDELTHLFNHRHLDELLTAEVKKANRYKRPLGLVIVSLKNFTAINEAFGHEEGDGILEKTADAIRKTIREVDIPARYGDNEFAVILPESDEEAASVVAGRIQQAISSISLASREMDFSIVTNCGIAALSTEIQNKDDLMRTALGALLEAKKNGHNAICTSGEISAKRREVHENRRIIEQVSEKLNMVTAEAERNYFQSLLKIIGEVGFVKKILMPHSERVAFFAQRLAERVGMNETEVRSIHRAGLLHDAGKLAIDSAILTKAGRLTSAELELIRQHPLFAVQMIGKTPLLVSEPAAILHHHERYDGLGYPEGLSGESIPMSARILCIAEAWDTMITPQSYRSEPLPLDAALSQLKEGAGTQFDPNLIDRFTSLITS